MIIDGGSGGWLIIIIWCWFAASNYVSPVFCGSSPVNSYWIDFAAFTVKNTHMHILEWTIETPLISHNQQSLQLRSDSKSRPIENPKIPNIFRSGFGHKSEKFGHFRDFGSLISIILEQFLFKNFQSFSFHYKLLNRFSALWRL